MNSLILFLTFFTCHFMYQAYNMFIAKNAPTLTLFSRTFESIWTYLFAGLIVFTPLLSLANFGFSFGFQYGLRIYNNVWSISAVFISAQLFSTLFSALIFFGQNSIEKGPVLGFIISLLGLTVANLWK